MSSDILTTRHTKVRYGDREIVGGVPVLIIKSRGKTDFVTAEEILEDLYGKPVERIIFKEPIFS